MAIIFHLLKLVNTSKDQIFIPCIQNNLMVDNFIQVPNIHWNSLYFQRILILESIKNIANLVKGDLLDIGCGTQPYRSLFKKIKSYTGIDVNSSCHELSPDVIIYDGESIPFPPNSFDWAMSTEVFEHIRRPDLLLQSLFDVLRPGGCFFLTVPFLAGIHEAPYDFRRWTNYGLVEELSRAGFERIEVRPLGNWHISMAVFLKSYIGQFQTVWWTKFWLSRLVWIISNIIAKLPAKPLDNMCINWFAIAYKPEINN